MLPTIFYHRLNQLEPNLYEYSCQRHQKNLFALPAYAEAQRDEMRQLFHRVLDSDRFSDETNIANYSISN